MDHNIHTYIAPGRRAHLVGIGGVSMSPLAEVLHGAGMVITGSDMREGTAVAHLRSLSSVPLPSTTATLRSRRPGRGGYPSLNGLRHGAPL